MPKYIPLKLFLFPVLFFITGSLTYSQTGSDTTCSNGISIYQKTYGGNKDDYGFYLAPTTDSGYVIGGRTLSFGAGGNDGLLMKVNKRGNFVWSKAIGGSGNDYFQVVIRTSDNGFLGVGQTKSFGNPAGDGWLVKTDASGNVQWSKKYGDGNANGDIAFDVVEIAEGGFIFCGTHRYAAGVAQGFVVRTDNLGNVTWSKEFGNSGSDQLWALTEDGSSIVVAGFYQSATFYDGYVMKLDKSNGTIQWIKGYDAENRSTEFYRIKKNGSGFQVLAVVADGFNVVNQQNFIWNLNSDGTVQNVRKMVIPGTQNLDFGWYPRTDGGFISVNGDYTSNSDLLISNVNPDGSLAWSKKYVRTGQQFINNLMPSPEGGYAGVGYNNTPGTPLDSNNVYLLRFDSLGTAGNCSGVNTNDVTVSSAAYSNPVPDVVAIGNLTINNPVITAGVVAFTPVTNLLCFYCKPKPTGTARPLSAGISEHDIVVFPNPVLDGELTVVIKAAYADRATLNVIDLYGNNLYSLPERDIRIGENRINFNLPRRLQRYANYFIVMKFNNYSSSTKIFVLKN